jgi:hypothetical protein
MDKFALMVLGKYFWERSKASKGLKGILYKS